MIPCRRDRLPTLVFLGFPGGSAGKESACNAGDPGSIPGFGKIPWRKERRPTPVSWPGEFHGLYSPRARKQSDTTEQLSVSFLQEDWLRTGNSAQCSVAAWMGWEFWGMDPCTCMVECLYGVAETPTTLLISYSPIQNKKSKEEKKTG